MFFSRYSFRITRFLTFGHLINSEIRYPEHRYRESKMLSVELFFCLSVFSCEVFRSKLSKFYFTFAFFGMGQIVYFFVCSFFFELKFTRKRIALSENCTKFSNILLIRNVSVCFWVLNRSFFSLSALNL